MQMREIRSILQLKWPAFVAIVMEPRWSHAHPPFEEYTKRLWIVNRKQALRGGFPMSTGILPVFKASFFLNQKREDGLKLRVIYAGDHVYADFQLSDRFQSESNSPYNGIFFGIMDVLMWYAILMKTKKICMTKKITVEFLEPLVCSAPYRAKSKLMDVKGKDYYVTAWTEDGKGKVYTKVDALFREGKDVSIADILRDFDFSETTPEMKEFFSTFF